MRIYCGYKFGFKAFDFYTLWFHKCTIFWQTRSPESYSLLQPEMIPPFQEEVNLNFLGKITTEPANKHVHIFKSAIGMDMMVLTQLITSKSSAYQLRIWSSNTMLLNRMTLLDAIVDQNWIFTLRKKPEDISLLNKTHHPLVGKRYC